MCGHEEDGAGVPEKSSGVKEQQHCAVCGVPVFTWRGLMYATREEAEAVRASELKRRHDFRYMRKWIERAQARGRR